MAQPVRHLQVVDPETGELHDCPECQAKQDQLDGLTKEIQAWRARYANLKRDREADAKGHPLWHEAIDVFNEWRRATNHPGCKWSVDRFELIEPLLRLYGKEMCQRAVAGAAFDPFITKRKNGSVKRHDGLELVFRDAAKFEEFCCRAPKGWKPGNAEPPDTEASEGSGNIPAVNQEQEKQA